MEMQIGGTGLTVMTRADQNGYGVTGARIPATGTGDTGGM